MTIGNIGNNYGAYNYTNKVKNNSGKSFGEAIGNVTKMASPVYKMKVWDMDDNLLEERTIDINSIDPNNADSYEMYALSVYGEKSGNKAYLNFLTDK